MTKRMTLLVVLAAQACSAFGINDDWSMFIVQLEGDGTDGALSGEVVRVNNSPYDPRGMAGIEVEINGIDGLPPALTLTGADFRELPLRWWETKLPDSGQVSFVVRLRDPGRQLVAEEVSGSFTITSEPTNWRLSLDREPLKTDDIQNLLCPDPYWRCHEQWMRGIHEDARNYPSEVLRIVLYRRQRFECPNGVLCN